MADFDREILEKVLLASIKEQRAARRWRIFFRLIGLSVVASIIWGIYGDNGVDKLEHNGKQVAVVNFVGEINKDNQSYQNLIDGVTDALKDSKTVAVLIRANSPGGSPVYSNMMNSELLRLRKKYPNKPIDFVIEEVCASGCYYAAVAADKIYANPASIVGSIGVIYAGFGAVDAMKKLGIENRLMTAGKNKAMGYPLNPINPNQQQMQQQMLDDIHTQFIQAVQNGRGKKLANDPDIFSGRYWVGDQSLKLGLIDGYGSVDSVAREQFQSDNIVDFTKKSDAFDKISKKFGVTLSDSVKQAVSADNLLSKNTSSFR